MHSQLLEATASSSGRKDPGRRNRRLSPREQGVDEGSASKGTLGGEILLFCSPAGAMLAMLSASTELRSLSLRELRGRLFCGNTVFLGHWAVLGFPVGGFGGL